MVQRSGVALVQWCVASCHVVQLWFSWCWPDGLLLSLSSAGVQLWCSLVHPELT